MAASHGHGPRHVLFLVTVSTLLSYAVGITVTASLDLHFTHFSESCNARIFPQLGSWHRARYPIGLAHEQHLIAAAARQFLSATRWPASSRIILIKSHAVSHITQYKEQHDGFLAISI
jgi:hypothetical protein